ncbi:spx domain-containing protein [Stemphylium lycopersici]|nr:spx domain-containing protein [Stemphylium lycopersici]RAR00572.1 spx domain-containing protein [Stemphylium lycopersici]
MTQRVIYEPEWRRKTSRSTLTGLTAHMESRASNKRLWENDEAIEVHSKRRSSPLAASYALRSPPLPPLAAHYGPNRTALDQPKLPSLTSSCNASTGSITSRPQHLPPPQELALLSRPDGRPNSFVDNEDNPSVRSSQAVDTESQTIYYRISPLDLPQTQSESITGFGPTSQITSVFRPITCCSSDCQGQICTTSRSLTRKLAADLGVLVDRVKHLTRTEKPLSSKPPESSNTQVELLLRWALNLVHEGNLQLQEHTEQQSSRSPRSQSSHDDSPNMRRIQPHPEECEEQSPALRQHQGNHDHDYSTRLDAASDEIRRDPYGAVNKPTEKSPHLTSSQSLPSMIPPITSPQSAVHNSQLKELQHQVSVKTLEFKTLQCEYKNLIQKLERQKTKCATLENKLEIGDIEISTLTEEKERLQSQVTALEAQVEELQQSRDEARRQIIANGGQYMRIMDMANKLQSQGADDKKKWEAEKERLQQRIRVLEEAMVTGSGEQANPTLGAERSESANPALPLPSSSSQSETINVLRAEVTRLRSRTQTLESAIQTMRRESISIQTAAKQLMESSDRLEAAAEYAMGGGRR